MKSIRHGLMLRLGLASFALALLAGLVLYVYMRSTLIKHFDATLIAKATAVGTQVKREGDGRLEFEFDPKSMPEFSPSRRPEYFEIWLQDGRLIQKSTSLADGDLPRGPIPDQARSIWNLNLPDGRSGRAIRARILPPDEPMEADDLTGRAGIHVPPDTRLIVVVAVSREQLNAVEDLLMTGLLIAAGLMSLGTLAVLHWGIGSGLRPLRQLAQEVSGIDARTLSHRFALPAVPLELAPICDRLNGFLDRLQAAFERERRFTANVAHDLRTPLTELRTMAEICAKWPEEAGPEQRGWQDVIEVTHRMEVVVSTLLTLSRCQEDRQKVQREAVSLSAAITEAWRPFAGRANARGIAVEFAKLDEFDLLTDRALFASILENLFSNATEYCPRAGRMTCTAIVGQECIVLTICNSVNGLAHADVERMFEPFWRKDPSRQDSGHSGLGLALVAAYAKLLGIEIGPELRDDGCFAVQLSIPRCHAEPALGRDRADSITT